MATSRRLIGLSTALFLALGVFSACGGDDGHAPPSLPPTGGGGRSTHIDASAGGDAGDEEAGPGDATAPDAGDVDVSNCGTLVCSGHSNCAVKNGVASCACDAGYVRPGDSDEGECIVDTSCVRLKPLQRNFCRYLVNDAAAVAVFFAVDYCAGTAVLPEDLGNLDGAFAVLEDGKAVGEESFAQVLDRDVESYITIALDVSTSLTNDKDLLGRVVGEVRQMIDQLRQVEPPVSVSIEVFGPTVQEYVPFTSNLDEVDAKLADIVADPSAVNALVGSGGTALHAAVKKGVHSVERIQALREAVTEGGVLTTGTVVVVTDGKESTTAVAFDPALLEGSVVNVISVGVSADIDGASLAQIGPAGSFLAATPDALVSAFDEIAVRVRQYPERAYFLGYCASFDEGEHTVSVTLKGEVEPEQQASCKFNASLFAPADSPDRPACGAAFFADSCEGRECGGLTACGKCDPGACCANDRCVAPSRAGDGCSSAGDLCADGSVCLLQKATEDGGVDFLACATPAAVNSTCSTFCAPGESYCDMAPRATAGTCKPVTLELGDECGNLGNHSGRVCPEGNCAQRKLNNEFDKYVCLPQARVFDACSGANASATCEPGAACQGNNCVARSHYECATNLDCISGVCNRGYCSDTGFCPFSWDEKLTQ